MQLQMSLYFNPRSREGSDIIVCVRCRTLCYFNPRSREGSDKDCIIIQNTALNFNPRSREGSDEYHDFVQYRIYISIHAPARGATLHALRLRSVSSISIHAPARGATLHALRLRSVSSISIHAPARGATGGCVYDYFIFRFQSTLPRGERQVRPSQSANRP